MTLKEELAGPLALLKELTEACKADSGISDALIGNAFRHHVLSYRRILNEIQYADYLNARPEEARVVAWLSKDHNGMDITISDAKLKKEPPYVQNYWEGAIPLYSRAPQPQEGKNA